MLRTLLAALFLFAPLFAHAGETDGRIVEIWTRRPGTYARGDSPGRMKVQKLDLDAQKLDVERRFDLQEMDLAWYRGVSLAAILGTYVPAYPTDTAILHFSNGMAIAVPVDEDAIARIDAFVARDRRASVKDAWSRDFPEITRPNDRFRDPRPLAFSGNKLVVGRPWHPMVRKDSFTPWRHATTLTGIELVDAAAYWQQFTAKGRDRDPEGLDVFARRCHYCHGVSLIGASHGWDFLEPVPVRKFKQPLHLYQKLRYPYHDAVSRGLLMPQQDDVTEAEMQALWRWLRSLEGKELRPYRP